jgi:hypothetical protein
MISARIARGELPRRPPTVTWAGRVTGERPCAACDFAVTGIEFELLFEDGRVFYFHALCFALWSQARDELV